jgi:class I fructose-bisphosphate aldolase
MHQDVAHMTHGICSARLNKLFNPETGRTITIPMDHGFYVGNIPGLEDPWRVLETLIEEKVDATLLSYGLGKLTNSLFLSKDAPARVLAMDATLRGTVPGENAGVLDNDMFCTVEQALKWGFDAVKVLLIWGLEPELQMKQFKTIGRLVAQCDRWDMPLMIEPVLWGKNIPPHLTEDPDTIAHAARIALEMGADILKVPYTGDVAHFRSLTQRMRVPVVILGGAGMESTEKVLQTALDSVRGGGRGVVFGRNVWQNGKMREIIRGLKTVVNEEREVREVMESYRL